MWARGAEYGTLEAMRIVVCVKHVPDMQSERRFEGGRLVRGEGEVYTRVGDFTSIHPIAKTTHIV